MPPSSPAYRMADRLLKGKLAARLDALLAEGLSYPSMAKQLFAEAGVESTGETLRAWHNLLQREQSESEAS